MWFRDTNLRKETILCNKEPVFFLFFFLSSFSFCLTFFFCHLLFRTVFHTLFLANMPSPFRRPGWFSVIQEISFYTVNHESLLTEQYISQKRCSVAYPNKFLLFGFLHVHFSLCCDYMNNTNQYTVHIISMHIINKLINALPNVYTFCKGQILGSWEHKRIKKQITWPFPRIQLSTLVTFERTEIWSDSLLL